MELALGNYLTLRVPPANDAHGPGYVKAADGWSELRFQNFWIGRNAVWRSSDFPEAGEKVHAFLPFGFSGAVLSRQGDNIEAGLVFPNSEISRNFLDQAVTQRWTAVVRVVQINKLDEDGGPEDYPTLLYRYKGIVSSGGWSEDRLELSLSSILDAVGANLPVRSLQQRQVGSVPFTSNIALQ